MQALSRIACLLAMTCLGACASTPVAGVEQTIPETFNPGSTWKQVVAEIAFINGAGELTREVHAASTVRVGEPLTVEVTSYGGGCEAQGSGEVAVEGLEADIHVFDYTFVPLPAAPGMEHVAHVCTTPLKMFRKRFPVHFDQRGEAVVRVHGKRRDVRTPGRDLPEVVTLRVRVR